jgi:hypothetical protein
VSSACKQGKIGRLSFTPEHDPFSMREFSVVDPQTEEEFAVRPAGCLHLGDVKDAIKALVTWNPLTDTKYNNPNTSSSELTIAGVTYRNQVSELTNNHWNILCDVFGTPCHGIATLSWLQQTMQKHTLVDTFAVARPYVRGYRYTCWEQYTNRRYANEGSRIDMMLMDREWWAACGVIGRELSGFDMLAVRVAAAAAAAAANNSSCCAPSSTPSNSQASNVVVSATPTSVAGVGTPAASPLSQPMSQQPLSQPPFQGNSRHLYTDQQQLDAAMLACTGNGMFIPAPMTGGGIPAAVPLAYEQQFLGPPHTGIIYTPPEFSDHVGISLCLSIAACPQDFESLGKLVVTTDAETKFTQPFRQQRSITALFQKQRQQLTVTATAASTTTPVPSPSNPGTDSAKPVTLSIAVETTTAEVSTSQSLLSEATTPATPVTPMVVVDVDTESTAVDTTSDRSTKSESPKAVVTATAAEKPAVASSSLSSASRPASYSTPLPPTSNTSAKNTGTKGAAVLAATKSTKSVASYFAPKAAAATVKTGDLADQRENDAVEQPSATAKRINTGTLFDHFAKKSKN